MKIIATPVIGEEIKLSSGTTFWPWQSKIIKTSNIHHVDYRLNIPILDYKYICCCDDDENLSIQERCELADYMIEQWTKFKASI